MLTPGTFEFHYHFQFADGSAKDYDISLDPNTLSLISAKPVAKAPEWVHLHYNQCRECPLEPSTQPCCPIALNIMDLVEAFKSVISYKDCLVICETHQRTYSKQTSVMEGLSAIFGIIMATSDCPVMEFLKPMARFHLPFASVEETTVRTASMYLLAQYYKYKDQPEFKFDFGKLERHYQKVQMVNEGLLARIKSISSEDADKNAIVTLHSLSQFLSMEMDISLSGLAHYFMGRYQD